MAATDYVSLRRLGTFLSLVKQWVLSFVANRNTQTMSDVTVNTGISGTATIGKSITIHTASGAQTASVMNSNMITNTEPSSNKDKVTKAPTYDLMENTVMTAISDAFDDITTIEYQVINNSSQLPATGTNGVIYLAAIYSEVENPTGNPHDLGYYTLSNNVYTLTSDTSVQEETTYYKKEDAYDEYIWLTPENRYEKLGQASIDISGLKFAGSATSGGSALQSEAIPFGSTSSTSSATAFLATVNGITELKDGTCLILKNTKVTSAAATSDPKCFTLDVNGLGAKKVYVTTAAATYATTQFTLNYKYLFVFDSSLDSGNGGWYIGQLFNTNDNTLAYNIRRSYSENKMYVGLYRYQICLTKDDDNIVPVYLPPNPTSTASSQYSTGTAKILTEETFNPWGTIWWYSTTTVVSAGSAPGTSYMWDMYSLVDIRYSFNTGSTLVANHDVFMTCEPQDTGFARLHNYIVKTPTTSNPKTEGLFEKSYQSLTVSTGNPKMRGWFKNVNNEYILAVDTSVVEGTTYYQQKFAVTTDTSVNASKTYYQKVNPITQELPTTDDGFIYVRLGRAYDTYRFSMDYYKPVYYFKDGELRLWTNQTTPKYKSQYFSINPEGELDLVSGSITKSLLSSGVQASLNKADDAVQSVELNKYNSDATEGNAGTSAMGQTDVKVDDATIGTIVTSYAPGTSQRPYVAPSWYALNTKLAEKADVDDIAAYISERNFVEHDSTQHSNGSGTCSYADSFGSTNFYSTGPITYTVAPNQKISFDSQDSTTGYIVKASGSGDGTNQAILASKTNGDVEWFNDTGSSVIIRFASATNNENYSYTIVDCGYDDTIEHVYDKIGDVVQSVVVSQTSSGNDPGTTISVNGATPNPIVKDNEPGGSSNANVAPSWGAMKEAISGKQDTISDLATIRSDASKGATALQPTDVRDELDPGGNGEIADSAAIAAYIDAMTLADFASYPTIKMAEGSTLKSSVTSTFILTLTASNPVGWYRVMGLGPTFAGVVTLTGDYYSASPSIATFVIGGRANDTAYDIVQLNGNKNSNVDKIRLVSNENGDHKFYFDIYKATANNCNNIYVTFTGYALLTKEVTNTVLADVSSTYIRKTFELKNGIPFVEKVTSTDNAIARFDGTGGAIQNSGVIINDSNHVSAVKFISYGGTSKNFVKGDGSLDSSAYIKENAWLMPTNAFGGSSKAVQINLINNGFYAAHLRATVTLTGFTAGSAGQLFDGNYETCLTLPAGQTGVILIDSGNTALFGTYSYGYTYFSFYYNNMPDSISMRVYGTRSSGGEGWYDLGNATAFYESAGSYCYRIQNSGTYNCKKWEITIVAKSDTIAKPCQIDHQFSRGATAYMPVVTKFAMKQDLWGDVEAPKFIRRGGTSNQFLKADGSVDSNNYVTLTSLNSALSEKVDYADGTKTTTTKQMGTTAVTVDGISMYTSESTTYTIQNGYTISIDAQGTSMGYIYQNSNSTILAQDPSGDVEWTNTTGESVVVKIGSATSGENYSIAIFKKGYYSTIEELTEKIEEAAASGVQADWNEDDSTDPAYIKNKPTVYTKPLSGIPKSDLANAVQTSLGKADSAVQSVTITQSSVVGTGGTTIQVDNGNAYHIVSDGEPQGSGNGYVAPTWGAMKTLLGGKVDSVELVKHKTDESDESYDTCQTDLFVDDISLGTIVATAKPVTSQRPYVAPSWQGFEEKLSEKSDKSNTYTKSEVDGLVSGINNNVIIGELPTTGQLQNRIYRVPGTNSYTDWAWDGSDWVKLAEFSGSIFMQITEAEYDALSDSEKNNGTWYFIEEE